MFNERQFQIHNIDYSGANPNIVTGCVTILANERSDRSNIIQAVTAKIRVQNDTSMSVEELHEALHQKAIEQLKYALNMVEGKTAKELQA